MDFDTLKFVAQALAGLAGVVGAIAAIGTVGYKLYQKRTEELEAAQEKIDKMQSAKEQAVIEALKRAVIDIRRTIEDHSGKLINQTTHLTKISLSMSESGHALSKYSKQLASFSHAVSAKIDEVEKRIDEVESSGASMVSELGKAKNLLESATSELVATNKKIEHFRLVRIGKETYMMKKVDDKEGG